MNKEKLIENFKEEQMINYIQENHYAGARLSPGEKHLIEKTVARVKEIIQSESEETHDGCKGCQYEDKQNHEYPCSSCKQCYIDKWKLKQPEIITNGDKIRESNESLAEFIKQQFADERVYIHGNVIDIEDYLNQKAGG